MSWAVSHVPTVFLPGEIHLVPSIELTGRLADAERLGLLPALLSPPPGPAGRGQLAVGIEAAIETALERRGACPPGIRAASSLDAAFTDQLYRARLLEFSGIALAIPWLAGIADRAGILDADDSAVLRWWLGAADRSSLWLLLDARNAALAVYGPPRPLEAWLDAGARREPRDTHEPTPAVQPAVAESAAAMELSEPPPAVIEHDGALAFHEPFPSDDEPFPSDDEPLPSDDEPLREVEPETDVRHGLYGVGGHDEESSGASAGSVQSIGDIAEAILKSLAESSRTPSNELEQTRDPASDANAMAGDATEPEPTATVTVTAAPQPEAAERDAATPIAVPPLFPNAGEQWRTWARELETARGPKPLAAIERMFISSYVPLCHALGQGITDPECERALTRWSTSFGHSYREAFEALRVRGKRPTMVLDAPEIAQRIGRLHGARSVQLVLVDGLRFDLGLRVEQRVRAIVGQQAALAERLLLWSALPSTTEVQLDLIGRGPEGLRAGQPPPDVEVPVARGRSASTFRRVKAGQRELLKLDIVEARLAEPGGPEPERLDAIADETARSLADYLTKQVPRTLVFAFGDHGFVLDPLDAPGADQGTTRGRQGGTSPEEVLVPAFAWLVAGMH